MTRLWIFFLILALAQSVEGQRLPLKEITQKIKLGQTVTATDFGFREYRLPSHGDTVIFYTYQKQNSHPTSIYVFLPGTNAENIYSYHKDVDSSYWYNSLTSFDFSYLPSNYLFVIVAKPGFGFCGNGDSNVVPLKYWEKTSLADRVMRADVTINYIHNTILKKPEKTVVFGYSEGFYVAAKLATVNKTITHLGIGGGGGYIDFYDFILSNQKSVLKTEMEVDTAIKSNQEIISALREIMTKPNSIEFKYGYTFKRWSSFAEPPIYNLTKVFIPIYQVHGTNDESTPVENAYIVPTEFARLKKNNLTFRVYPKSDHSLIEHQIDGKELNHWDEMMRDFFNWVTLHPK